MISKCLLSITIAFIALTQAASGDLVFDLGNTELLPNQAGQEILIGVSTTDGSTMVGVNVFIEFQGVGESFPTFSIVSNSSNVIQSGVVYDRTGFVFGGLSADLDEVKPRENKQAFFVINSNPSTERAANGIFAAITVDTTGINSGEFMLFDLGTTFTQANNDELGASSVIGGTVTVGSSVPEPTSLLMLGCSSLVLLSCRRRS